MSFTAYRKPGDEPHALFQVAGEDYVGARLSFVGGAAFPAQLAMQQCVETAAKAVLKSVTPGRQFIGRHGHEIRLLLGELAPARPRIRALLDDRDTGRVLEVLERGYNPIRYGEGILGMELGATLNAFDTIAWNLLTDVGAALGYGTDLNLHVGEQALPSFLWKLKLPVTKVKHHRSGPDDEWPFAIVSIASPPAPDGDGVSGVP
jgi:HEPN domain-containing protein